MTRWTSQAVETRKVKEKTSIAQGPFGLECSPRLWLPFLQPPNQQYMHVLALNPSPACIKPTSHLSQNLCSTRYCGTGSPWTRCEKLKHSQRPEWAHTPLSRSRSRTNFDFCSACLEADFGFPGFGGGGAAWARQSYWHLRFLTEITWWRLESWTGFFGGIPIDVCQVSASAADLDSASILRCTIFSSWDLHLPSGLPRPS